MDINYVTYIYGFLLGWVGFSLYVTKKKLKKWESKYDFTNHNYIGKVVILQGEEWKVVDFTMQGNKVILKHIRKGDYLYVDRTLYKPTL